MVNLATGAIIRTLRAADGAVLDHFGASVAISGDVACIGAYGANGKGAVYLFNLSTGGVLSKLHAADLAASDNFGTVLAVEGNLLAIAAPDQAGTAGSQVGAVYLFDLAQLTQVAKILPASGSSGEHFGTSMAMHQGKLVIGSDAGSAFVYDTTSNTLNSLVPLPLTGNFGGHVAIRDGVAAVSYVNPTGRGHVLTFDVDTGIQLNVYDEPVTSGVGFYGLGVVLAGNALLVTAPNDSTQGTQQGAAYLFKPITLAMPFTKVVAKGDYAPNGTDINYGTTGDAYIDPTDHTIFTSMLAGFGSNGGHDSAVFNDMVSLGTQVKALTTRQTAFGSTKIAAIGQPVMNMPGYAIGLATLTGPGVSAFNNTLIWQADASSTAGFAFALGVSGLPFPAFTRLAATPTLLGVQELVGSNGTASLAAICSLRQGAAFGNTSAANDSGLWTFTLPSASNSVREGDAVVSGKLLGQFAPRVCLYNSLPIYSAALTNGPGFSSITAANNAALLVSTTPSTPAIVAQKNDAATTSGGTPMFGTHLSAFIGESSNGVNDIVYRATFSGGTPAATMANNEGLWIIDSTPSNHLLLQKGESLILPSGAAVKVARIISFWGMGQLASESQALVLVQLSGTGITAANDQALVCCQTDGSVNILMREGDVAPGCDGAKIGVISRIEADAASSCYAVLATLTGATTSSDLALFTGNVLRGNTTSQAILRRPFLRLRKGQLFDNQPSPIKSISLPVTNVTASGAGGTGRGRAISYTKNLVLTVEFNNGVRQIVKGSVR